MPFKFLKKRQYNVTSKSFFVIPVHHLLDTSTTVDCTISSESKGQECLDNVCQRLLVQQPEFFGLRYVKGKEEELRWVDLERSLSRQLEKYAAGTKLYLRVRHYVTSGVRHLTDEVTRYYYFLQLKNDIYEGKITCDIRTAILLALYCRQAEYDSYQNDKQTKEYLKKSLVLPKNLQGLANDDDILEGLIVEVLQQNVGIQHLTQSQAEEMYIQCCQQLDGYGEERFQAKDTLGNDLLLGLSINGMVVNAENGRQYFPWKDFHTVTIDKKTIKIEQNKADGSIVGSFNFSEADMARYFWKLCITHHKFFKRYIDEDSPSMGDTESGNGISIAPTTSMMGTSVEAINAASAFGYDFSDSREDLLLEQQQRAIYTSSLGGGPGGIIPAAAAPEYLQSTNFQQQQQQMANTSALMSSNISLATSHQSGNGGINITGGGGGTGSNIITAPHMSSTSSWLNKDYISEYGVSSQQLSGSMLDTRLQQSSSCLDLSNNNLHHSSSMLSHSNNHNNNNLINVDAHERERLKAMLPTYRPAPDYETAVQLKYRSPSSELHNTHAFQAASNTALHANNKLTGAALAYYAGSQPDVHQATTGIYSESMLLNQLAPHRYPDVAQPAAALHHHYNAAATTGMGAAAHNSVIAPGANAGGVYIDMAQHLQMLRSKPPPPYPVNRLSSSSTPDLAVASHRPLLGYHRTYVTGSSPDLVSNRNLLNHHYHPYAGGNNAGSGNGGAGVTVCRNGSITSGHQTNAAASAGFHQYPYMSHMGHSQQYLPHGTFENLNMIEEQPSIVSQLRQSAISQAAASQAAASQSYEQQQPSVHSPAVYQTNANNMQHTTAPSNHQNTPAPLQRSVLNGSVEPIYENVPFSQNNNNSPNIVTSPPPSTTPAAAAMVQPIPPQRNSEQRSSGASINAHEAIRNRTASIQSAPGAAQQPPVPAARHHHHQQQQQQAMQQHQQKQEIEPNSTQMATPNRGAGIEMQFFEPTPPQRRGMRAASAAPAIGISSNQPQPTTTTTMQQQTPPPRQHHNKMNATKNIAPSSSSSKSTVDINAITSSPKHGGVGIIGAMTTSRSHHHLSSSHDDTTLQQQFGAMNLSASSASASSSLYNSAFETTTNSTVNSSNSSTTKDTKRKKRWNVFGGRSKTPDKQKSATLGREKASPSTSVGSKWLKPRSVQDDLSLPHQRWSTGTAANSRRSQPLSAQYSKDKLCEILNDKYNDPQLFIEFESISKRRDFATYECALAEENACKNTDPNFLPYDDNRVRLTPTMDNRHGYVNASHISATVGTKQRFYIVAQSPHDELTTRIFWQCVWEADVYLVVQLSDDLNYIPPSTHQCLEFGQFQVYQEFSQSTDRSVTSKLRLYHMQSRRYRSVWHLNYTNWAEQNCPRDVNHFLDFIEELNSVRMASINEVPPGHNTNPPVLLHCHEGGGRSGVTLTADLLLYTLDHNEDLDIPRVIGQLRHQRDRIIPSLAQYKFIYSLLYTYLKRTRLI